MTKNRQYGTGSVLKIKHSNGQWSRYWYIFYYANGRQIRESTKMESKMEAEKLLQRRMGEAGMGRTPVQDLKHLKYEEIRDAYLEEAKNKKRGALYVRRDGSVVVSGLPHLDKFFKGMPVVGITTDTLRRYIAARKQVNAKDATIRRNLVILRAMMNQARKEQKLELHNVPYFPMPQDSDAAGQYVSPEVFVKLLAALPEKLRPFFRFLYYTGCRIGAAKKITWAMLNGKRDVIKIPAPLMKARQPLTIVLDGVGLEPVAVMLKKMFAETDKPVFYIADYRVRWQKACTKLG
ncbi:MAG: hypothetical protein WA185_06370, partial [Candidatus Acidiferrales bacterium]